MASLYELTETYRQIQMMVEDEQADEQVLNDTLDSIDWTTDFEEKCDNYVMVIRNTEVSIGADEGQIKVIEKYLEDLKNGVKVKKNRVSRMRENLCSAMIKVGKPKFESQRFKYWTQKNPASVVIDNPENIPMEFYRVPEPEINKAAIKEALQKGEKLDFAHLEQKEGVRFK